MQIDQFTQFMAHARSEGVVLFHSGLLDQETIAATGAALRRRLQEKGATGKQSRKVFSTFMEMAQNVVHYAAPGEPEGKFAALSVETDEEGYQVTCGNFMDSAQVPRVRARLESVQGMSPELVREAYRRQLASEDSDPDSKGAGLGLLTMAAAARQPIEFTFGEPSPDGTTFLFLQALI